MWRSSVSPSGCLSSILPPHSEQKRIARAVRAASALLEERFGSAAGGFAGGDLSPCPFDLRLESRNVRLQLLDGEPGEVARLDALAARLVVLALDHDGICFSLRGLRGRAPRRRDRPCRRACAARARRSPGRTPGGPGDPPAGAAPRAGGADDG